MPHLPGRGEGVGGSPYLIVGYKCHCSSRHPRSGGPHPAALRGAWGWRRAPGGGGWSCGLGPHPHCSRGWRGRWTGSPPTAPPAGPGHSALPPPGSAPRPTPPLAAPGLWETENGPQRRQEVAQRGGEGRKGRGGDRGAGRPELSPVLSCALTHFQKDCELRGRDQIGCDRWLPELGQ